ncbi:hypothetical protein RQP46_007699 [Phenoliferia psychrophenolica]
MHFPASFLAAVLPFLLLASLTSGHSHHRRQLSHSRRSSPRSPRPLAARSELFLPSTSKVGLNRLAIRTDQNQHLPPKVLLQMHINRSVRRHARMSKRDVPTDDQLRGALVKRWETVGLEARARREKRQRGGKAMAGMSLGSLASDLNAAAGRVFAGKKNHGKAGKGAAAGAAAGGAAAATTSSANTTASTSSSTSSSAGFSQTDLDAANQGTVSTAETPTANATLGLNIEANDVGYFATVQLGTPPADFKILMDSGSADFWVPSEACSSCGSTHTTLGAKTSSSFKASTTQFQVTYGTGNVAGTIAQDDVLLAGLALTGHSFGVTTTESTDFSDASVPFDGLMGLAQSTLSEQGVLTPIESLAKAGTVQSAQLGFHLSRLSDGTNDGEVTFGGVDATKFTGSLVEVPNVNTQGFWEGAMDDISVDGTSLKLSGRTAILDTGTTLIVAPQADAEAVHAAIPGAASDGQGGFTVPCTTTASIALTFGGQSFTIQPSDLTFLPETNDLTGACVSGISAGSVGGANEWLVGDVFLKNVYFATDVQSNTIGLAPSVKA